MMSLKNFPNEILIQIYQLLRRQTLLQCALVCRSMKAVALEIYYAEVSLGSLKSSDLLTSRLLQGQAVSHSTSVKQLEISFDADIQLCFRSILVGIFTNITSIDFSKSNYCYQYMWSLAHDFLLSAKSMKLQEIAPPSPNKPQELISLYYQVCFTFRHTLRRYYTDCFIYMPDHPKFNIFNALPNYAKLTHLAIKNSRHLPGATSDIFKLIRFCPNLTCFKMTSGFAPVFSTPLPINYPNTKLKTLDLQFPYMSSSYFKYFVTHLNDYHQLETINIHLYEQFIYHWINDNDIDTLLQFSKIMRRSIKSLNIQMSSFDQSKFRRQDTEPKIKEILNDYWRFVSDLKKNKVLYSIISTHTRQDENNYTCHTIQMTGNSVCLTELGYQAWPYVDYASDLPSDQSLELSNNIGPNIVNFLYFKNVSSENAATTLRYALTNYTQLEYLSICLEEKYPKKYSFFSMDSTCGAKLSKAVLYCCKDISERVLLTMGELIPKLSEITWTEQSLKSCGQFNLPENISHLKKLTINFTDAFTSPGAWCLYLMVRLQNRRPVIYKSTHTEAYSKEKSQEYNFLPSSVFQMNSHYHKWSPCMMLPTMLIVNSKELDELILIESGDLIENFQFSRQSIEIDENFSLV